MGYKYTSAERRAMRRGHITKPEDWNDPSLVRDEISRLEDNEVDTKARMARNAAEIESIQKVLAEGPARIEALRKSIAKDEGHLEHLFDKKIKAKSLLAGANLQKKVDNAEKHVARLKRELERAKRGEPELKPMPAGETDRDPSFDQLHIDREPPPGARKESKPPKK